MKQTIAWARWAPLGTVVIGLLLGGCVSHLDSPAALSKMQGDWHVKRLDKAPVDEAGAYLTVNSQTGMLSGFDGCNQVRGPVRVEDSKWFAFLAGTRKACPNAQAEQVSAALHQGFVAGMKVGSISMGATVMVMTGGGHQVGLAPQ
ncbi:META domain-containing protein [Aeromonas sobria]|nr:META domain-containing protein [Aeromonas sobria]